MRRRLIRKALRGKATKPAKKAKSKAKPKAKAKTKAKPKARTHRGRTEDTLKQSVEARQAGYASADRAVRALRRSMYSQGQFNVPDADLNKVFHRAFEGGKRNYMATTPQAVNPSRYKSIYDDIGKVDAGYASADRAVRALRRSMYSQGQFNIPDADLNMVYSKGLQAGKRNYKPKGRRRK